MYKFLQQQFCISISGPLFQLFFILINPYIKYVKTFFTTEWKAKIMYKAFLDFAHGVSINKINANNIRYC